MFYPVTLDLGKHNFLFVTLFDSQVTNTEFFAVNFSLAGLGINQYILCLDQICVGFLF